MSIISSLLSALSCDKQNVVKDSEVAIYVKLFAFAEQNRLSFRCLDLFLFSVLHSGTIFLKEFAIHRLFVHTCDVGSDQSYGLHVSEVDCFLEIIEIGYFPLIETISLQRLITLLATHNGVLHTHHLLNLNSLMGIFFQLSLHFYSDVFFGRRVNVEIIQHLLQ